jgi:hypothetical protein
MFDVAEAASVAAKIVLDQRERLTVPILRRTAPTIATHDLFVRIRSLLS